MKKLFTTLLLSLSVFLSAPAQKDVYLTVKHMLGNSPFAFNQASTNDLGDNFSITRVDYYMSKFTIIHDGGIETPVNAGTYILAKGNNNVSVNLGNYDVSNVEGIKFYIGVDMPNNQADPTQWVAPSALAPQSPSMHWGWASGYRFVALEGRSGANLSTGFEMHGLFNENYFEQTVMATGFMDGDAIYINLDADYTQAIKGVNVTAGPIDHGSNATDLAVLQNFRDFVFFPGSGLPNSFNTIANSTNFIIYPNPSNGASIIKLETSFLNEAFELSVFDVTGRIIQGKTTLSAMNPEIQIDFPGTYIIELINSKGNRSFQKLIVR
jgi:hypothetical protein